MHVKTDMTQKLKSGKIKNWVALPTGTDILLFFTKGCGLHVFYSNGAGGFFLLNKPRNAANLLFQVLPLVRSAWKHISGVLFVFME